MDGLEASSVCTVRQRSEERRTKSEEEPSVGEVEEHGRREDKVEGRCKVEGGGDGSSGRAGRATTPRDSIDEWRTDPA